MVVEGAAPKQGGSRQEISWSPVLPSLAGPFPSAQGAVAGLQSPGRCIHWDILAGSEGRERGALDIGLGWGPVGEATPHMQEKVCRGEERPKVKEIDL